MRATHLMVIFSLGLAFGSDTAPPFTDCVDWDFDLVDVPEDVAFRSRQKDQWVSFDAKPEDVWSYWDRIEAATKAAGTKGLHEALGLHGNLTSAMADVMAAKGAV